jgi:hypothetical protein
VDVEVAAAVEQLPDQPPQLPVGAAVHRQQVDDPDWIRVTRVRNLEFI